VTACATPLLLGMLVDYWVDELPPDAETVADEHLIQCVECSQRLQWIAEVGMAARELFRHARVPLAVTPALLARLEQDGVRIRHHRVEAGGHTHCTAGPDDDLVGLTLRGEFRTGERIDLLYLEAPDFLRERRMDLPVDRERGEVVLVERGDTIRALPAQRVRIGLYGVSPSGERPIGEYTLLHSPWPGSAAD
jgi:glycine/D-amino acid oxidase-like deaminating enzyme